VEYFHGPHPASPRYRGNKNVALIFKGGNMRIVSAAVLAAIVLSGTAMAATTVTVTYTEPSQTVGGSPITNLKETAIFWKQDAKAEVKLVIPASKPAGGGAVSRVITVADPPVCGLTTITVSATATATTGDESARATPVSTTRDNSKSAECVKLKSPSNLTITIQ